MQPTRLSQIASYQSPWLSKRLIFGLLAFLLLWLVDLGHATAQTAITGGPILESVSLDVDTLTDGGTVEVTVRARSNAPVNWISRSLYGPNEENIYGGGHGATFNDVGENLWQYQWTDTISEWGPVGIYEFRGISVRNAGLLTSNAWSNLSFSVVEVGTESVHLPFVSTVD